MAAKYYLNLMLALEISENLKHELDIFCKQQNCERFPVFLATLQALLFRYSSQKEIVIGSRTVPGASAPSFVQYIATLEGSKTFRHLLNSARQPEILSLDSQPAEILLEALETKEPGLTPLYQIILNVWNEAALSGDVIMPDDLESPPFKLVIDLKEKDNKGQIACSVELFDPDLFPRFATHFVNILESGMNNPDQLISELNLLSKNEHEKIIKEWNDTLADIQGDGLIHHWI